MNNALLSALIADHEALDEQARILDNPPHIEIQLVCRGCGSSGLFVPGWQEIKHYADKGADMPDRLDRDACEGCAPKGGEDA